MSDAKPESPFGARLLQQDTPMNTSQYKEYRMKLDLALTTAERRERTAGIVCVASFFVAMTLMFVGGSKLLGPFDPTEKGANWLSMTLGAIYCLAAVLWPLSLAAYFARYRPAVRDAKQQLRDADIVALQREIGELRKLMESAPRRNGPA